MTDEAVISVKNLCMNYGRTAVLRDISLDIRPGAIHALLGPNGSGKSTLIKCILGLVIPKSGEITVQGTPAGRTWQYRSRIGYMPQIANFPENMKVKELIKMMKDLRGQASPKEEELIAMLKLEESLPKSLKSLSGGTRQKVNALLALMFDAPILIFDEATVGLDPVTRLHFKQYLLKEKEEGKTILLVSHFIQEVEELADEIIFMLEGKIYYQGSLEALKSNNHGDNLEKVIASILDPETINLKKYA
jgi:Cu-processing system ATP-binding protein